MACLGQPPKSRMLEACLDKCCNKLMFSANVRLGLYPLVSYFLLFSPYVDLVDAYYCLRCVMIAMRVARDTFGGHLGRVTPRP